MQETWPGWNARVSGTAQPTERGPSTADGQEPYIGAMPFVMGSAVDVEQACLANFLRLSIHPGTTDVEAERRPAMGSGRIRPGTKYSSFPPGKSKLQRHLNNYVNLRLKCAKKSL